MTVQTIKIFDTTLRDGQQCPGAGMSFERNIEYAHLAQQVGVDVLEAGFPAASQSEFMIVHTIAQEMAPRDAIIVAGLCQLRDAQVEITMKALMPMISRKRGRVHTYLPVDPELMRASLGSQATQYSVLIEEVYRLIKMASDAGFEVEFSPEGYSKVGENFDFATEVIRAAIEGGASIINCPDTIGGACRWQGEDYFVEKMKRHAQIFKEEFPAREITWSAHCHNDFGLALENTMNAVFSGPVTQIEGCFNGIGERSGNAPLEQCIAYIKYFGDHHPEKTFVTHAKSEKLQMVSDFVSRYMLPRQPHWPITGENSAKHTSGGHVNAIIKNPLAYQPFNPTDVGNEISFIFGPSSGGNHAKSVIEKYGYKCSDSEKAHIAQFIKEYYADRRKGVTDSELIQAYLHFRKPIRVDQFDYGKSGSQSILKISGEFFGKTMPVEMSLKGADSALVVLHQFIIQNMPGIVIENYQSRSASQGIDSVSECKIVIRTDKGDFFTGIGEDQDIEISALKALIDGVNQAYIHQHYKREIQSYE